MANKPWRTGVTFSLGLVTAYLDLWPVKVSGSGGSLFRNVCPTCEDATPCNNVSICPTCQGSFSPGELAKARPMGKDKLVKLTTEEVETIKAAFPIRQAELKICPAKEFMANTLPNGTAYTLRPSGKTPSSVYLVLRELVATEPHNVYYGKLKADANANPMPFRLDIWKGELLMVTVIPPATLDTVGEIAGYAEPKYLGMAKMLVEQIKAPFDSNFLADERIDRINEILKAKEAGTPIVAPPVASAPQTDNLLAALEASLASNRPG